VRRLTSTTVPGPGVDAADVLRAVQQERVAPVPEWRRSPADRQLEELREVIGLLRDLLTTHDSAGEV
jgi:hypothetical protein